MAGILQAVMFAVIAFYYSKQEVYTNRFAQVFFPLIFYVVYSFLDGSEYTPQGKYWPAFQKWSFWKWIVGPSGYFKGSRIVYEDKKGLELTRQCIFGAFPHGAVSFHHGMMMSDGAGFISAFPHLSCHRRRDLAANVCFKIPGWREFLLYFGCIDAAKETAKGVLRKGWSLYVLPGGELEQMLTKEGEHHVYINNRKGFIKLALEFGVDLVPVYTFGETDLYSIYNFMYPLRWWICKKFHVSMPLIRGVGLSLIPRRVPLHCVIGSPIKVEQSPCPSKSNIDALHSRFKQELQKLFDTHKASCGHPNAILKLH
eukprot:CAMPEP_0196582012 /NCGR_PEP_ID=MMETSP1081-20130531/37023_1 /TAXON_ID=36882 /ORGANISM="Pyramimonas amylifera, Strain CCMP720" /LENGTH=312 /DNA_ID=CAMNT_0041902465 /DNA_START=57 /DNA_END=995 /DNA_ORIENTATION=+